MRPIALTTAALLAASTLLAACGDMKPKIWPFAEAGPKERSREPTGASEYQCAAGKRFHLRRLDGNAVWLILPEREVRLEGSGGTRYAKGALVLELGSEKSTLSDGAAATYVDCVPAQPAAR